MKKKQASKVHSNPKNNNGQILNFGLFLIIQNNLDWHENCTTITRLQGKHNSIFYIENKH